MTSSRSSWISSRLALDVQEYNENGYYVFPEFLSQHGLKTSATLVNEMLAEKSVDVSPEWMMNTHDCGQDWIINEIACHPDVVSIVSSVIKSKDVALLQSQVFCKPPLSNAEYSVSSSNNSTPWHQDASSPSSCNDMATLWIPLDDVNESNGSLRVLPHCHTSGLLPSTHNPNTLSQFEKVLSPSFVSSRDSLTYNLKAGQAALHHPLLPHSSGCNTTTTYRRVLVLRFISANVLLQNDIPIRKVTEKSKVLCKKEEELYKDYRTGKMFSTCCILLSS